jgi:hypothetical protein
MLLNNQNRMRPALATVGFSDRTTSARAHREGFMADSSADTEAFGSFQDEPARKTVRGRQAPPKNDSGKSFFKNKALIIAIAAAIAVVLLIVVIALIVVNSSSDIRYTDNTYISYMDSAGNYRVSVNGTEISEIFEGETRVVPSLDRSFAYVES